MSFWSCAALSFTVSLLVSSDLFIISEAGNCRSTGCNCNFFVDSDVAILLNFKTFITKDPAKVLANWKKGVTCAAGWTGVCCDNKGRVQEIALDNKNLTGTIPSILGSLSNLRNLYMSANSFSGPIPPSFGMLKNLVDLFLPNNFLTGSIPPSIGNIVTLQRIYLRSNLLSGSIPATFGNLKQLTALYLNSNNLSGPLPASLGNLSNLQTMYLRSNNLSGPIPDTFGNLKSLQLLYLNYNRFTGSLPSSLGKLTKLTYMWLYSNEFTGVIPSSFGGLTSLLDLYLTNNQLSGSIPSSLGKLTNLQYLRLQNNQLTGSIPATLGNLVNLQFLILADNFLTGVVPSTLDPYCASVNPSQFAFTSNCLLPVPTSPCGLNHQKLGYVCSLFYPAPPMAMPPPPPKGTPSSAAGNTGSLFEVDFKKLTHQSSYFRHSSARYITLKNNPAWSVVTSISWAQQLPNWPVKDQGNCSSCWSTAPISAIEAALTITYASSNPPPNLSVQQVIDCEGLGSCAGGWPQNALEYASTHAIVNSTAYPLTGMNGTCQVPPAALGFSISHFETVDFHGWFGLLLAVQQQPIVVNIDASSSSFIAYTGGIYSDPNCYSNGLDHAVLLVGYNIINFPPYWVIRNSWGPNWGEAGHMRLQISGGTGVCGIGALPAYYPVVTKIGGSDPCNLVNYGVSFLNSFQGGGPGTVSPCGGYNCNQLGTTNVCSCLDPFVAVTNIDGTQSCVPATPCAFFTTNPCGVGNCVNVANGNYQCLCPLGYAVGNLSYNGQPTCAPASTVTGKQYYTVPVGSQLTCALIYQTYGIPKAVFLANNKRLNCAFSLNAGSVVDVTSSNTPCSLPYVLSQGDTCASVATLFSITLLGGVGSPNPDLDCSALIPGQQVCIIRGPAPDFPLCTFPYTLARLDTCASIITNQLNNDARTFFQLNPGLRCDMLYSKTDSSSVSVALDQVCLAATNFGSILKGCPAGKVGVVRPGDSCQHIAYQYFQGSLALYKKANGGHFCNNKRLFAGARFCSL